MDTAAAAIFAAAVAFALHATAIDSGPMVAAAAAAGFVLVWAGLRRVPVEEPAYDLPDFQLPPIEPQESLAGAGPGGAPLTAQPSMASTAATSELLLEDALVGVEPDARVVQLFHPRQPPTTDDDRQSAPLDASEALSDALAQLRRSLQ
ncbi:MAG TPA: hypothetical protein VMN38_07455 [Sphingomicrobium sp.]|nr:hypothetical protein [Sphingomicrobium sp.]